MLDLNPDNIGKVKDGCPVLDGEADRQAVVDWAGLVLCTGSTLCNGTIVGLTEAKTKRPPKGGRFWRFGDQFRRWTR